MTGISSTSETYVKKEQNEKLEEKIRKIRVRYMKQQKQIKALKNTIRRLKIKDSSDKYKKALQSILTEDQIKALLTKKKNVRMWSQETLNRAMQLRFACGSKGYEEVIHLGIPFPSLRTLRRKLECLKFEPGVLDDMMQFLSFKKSSFENDTDLECGLVFDEMAITPKRCYNPSTGSIVGDITFPNKQGTATHALVFMVVGIATRWKHVVGYHFTGNSFSSQILKEIIFQIILKIEELGFRVNFITSDMGPGNLGLWKLLGISTGRFSQIVNHVTHPFDSNRNLYIIADVPHILKNLKQALLNNSVLTISNDVMEKYNLSSNKIELNHFKHLLDIQEKSDLLLTPRLKRNDIECNNNFSKMRVSKATHIFSNDVSCSLELLADENNPEFATTAWFVKIVFQWFVLMTSRSCQVALGTKNENVYTEKIIFLNEVIHIFTNLSIGNGNFKPVQRGVIISTKSIIELTQYLISNRKFDFVLTSRFSQDCVENLFSQIRQKHVIPDALQFTIDLKLIAVSMYMKEVKSSSYNYDDGHYLSNLLEFLDKRKNTTATAVNNKQLNINIPQFNNSTISNLSTLDLNSLYNIAGYIIKSIKKICATCKNCIQTVQSETRQPYTFTKFVHLRCYAQNALFFTNIKTFEIFITLEKMFRYYSKYFKHMQNIDLKTFLIYQFSTIKANHILNCHQLYNKIIRRFAVFRLRIYKKILILLLIKDMTANQWQCMQYNNK